MKNKALLLSALLSLSILAPSAHAMDYEENELSSEASVLNKIIKENGATAALKVNVLSLQRKMRGAADIGLIGELDLGGSLGTVGEDPSIDFNMDLGVGFAFLNEKNQLLGVLVRGDVVADSIPSVKSGGNSTRVDASAALGFRYVGLRDFAELDLGVIASGGGTVIQFKDADGKDVSTLSNHLKGASAVLAYEHMLSKQLTLITKGNIVLGVDPAAGPAGQIVAKASVGLKFEINDNWAVQGALQAEHDINQESTVGLFLGVDYMYENVNTRKN